MQRIGICCSPLGYGFVAGYKPEESIKNDVHEILLPINRRGMMPSAYTQCICLVHCICLQERAKKYPNISHVYHI